MTADEYFIKLSELEKSYDDSRRKVIREFALTNNPVQVGDIVIDHMKKILVQSISISLSYRDLPCCIYKGIELKVDNTPKKNNIQSSVYQSNLKHHFKKVTI